jgi:hypothetical protein
MEEPADQPKQGQYTQETEYRVRLGAGGITSRRALVHYPAPNNGANDQEDSPLVKAVGDMYSGHRQALIRYMDPPIDGPLHELASDFINPFSEVSELAQREEDQQYVYEQRDVAHVFDECACNLGHDPVARQPRDTNQDAQYCRGEDARERHPDGVDHADPQRPPTSVGSGINAVTDGKARVDTQEVETSIDVSGF